MKTLFFLRRHRIMGALLLNYMLVINVFAGFDKEDFKHSTQDHIALYANLLACKKGLDVARALTFVVQIAPENLSECLTNFAATEQKNEMLSDASVRKSLCADALDICLRIPESHKIFPEVVKILSEQIIHESKSAHSIGNKSFRNTPPLTGVAGGLVMGDNATTLVGGSAAIGTAATGSLADYNISIGTATATGRTITIGNTTGATGIVERVGTGDYSLDGVGESTYTIGASTTSGTITIGGAAQTGNITLGLSTEANNVLIANGINAGAQTVNIANGASAADSTVNILSGAGTAGVGTLNLGDNPRVTTIDIGNITPAAARITTINGGNSAVDDTVNILAGNPSGNIQTVDILTGDPTGGTQNFNVFTGTPAAGTQTFNVFTGDASDADAQTVNIGSGNGDRTINIGTAVAGEQTITIGNNVVGTRITINSDTTDATNNAITIVGNMLVTGNILPSQTLTYDLGSEDNKWARIYTATIIADNLEIADLTVSGTANLLGLVGIGCAADTEDFTQLYVCGGANIQDKVGSYLYSNLFNVGQPSVGTSEATTTRQAQQVLSSLYTATVDTSASNQYIQIHAFPIEQLAAGTASAGMYVANFRNANKTVADAVAAAMGMLNFYGYGTSGQTIQTIGMGNILGNTELTGITSNSSLTPSQKIAVEGALAVLETIYTTTTALVFGLVSDDEPEDLSNTGILQTFVVG